MILNIQQYILKKVYRQKITNIKQLKLLHKNLKYQLIYKIVIIKLLLQLIKGKKLLNLKKKVKKIKKTIVIIIKIIQINQNMKKRFKNKNNYKKINLIQQ